MALLAPTVSYWWLCADEARAPRLVCLMYHRFVTPEQFSACTSDEKLYSITPEKFESHLQRLHQEGFETISLADALAFIHGEQIIAQKPVLITIDDGCES